ncbi:hypothetical protein C9374_010978 [Naegleria lovaniensis]|uniref:Uncharacterized protein n=1 Tax=Naegleria lovaniensis TaxID=51637 RepID=A0AA88GCT3_NAELO|nr:uncharacterized protein C9374_010978 [Naegleria lovaniensis]KAG2374141.1 hypothetical protein C9374_010978 [Naegleria lovaniensis]
MSSSETQTTTTENTSTTQASTSSTSETTTPNPPINVDPLANLPEFLKKGTIGFILKPGSSLHPNFIKVLWTSIVALLVCLVFMYYVPSIAKYHVAILFLITMALSITLFIVIPMLRQMHEEDKQALRKKLLLRKKRKLLEEQEKRLQEQRQQEEQPSTTIEEEGSSSSANTSTTTPTTSTRASNATQEDENLNEKLKKD